MWCIRLRFKPRVNAKWKMKGSLRPLTHEGFYATEKEAKSKVFDHRMLLEGYERRGGYWYPPMSMSSGGAVDVTVHATQAALKKPRKECDKERPVAPHGRKRAEPIELGEDSAGGGYVDEKALRAVAAIAGKDKNYVKLSPSI
jgi:hypothetical protein